MLRKKITSCLIVGITLLTSIGASITIINSNNNNNKVNNVLLAQAVQNNGQTVTDSL